MADIKYYYMSYSDETFEINWSDDQVDGEWVDLDWFARYDHNRYPTFDTLEECQNYRQQIIEADIAKLEKKKLDLSYYNTLGRLVKNTPTGTEPALKWRNK